MKLYDTINGSFVDNTESTISEVRIQVYKGEFTEHELKHWTLEGKSETDSTQLSDLLKVAYFYASGDSGSIISCSDGRHVDTVWENGIWDDGDHISKKDCHNKFEELSAEMDVFLERKEMVPEVQIEDEVRDAIEFAWNCVDDEIAAKYKSMTDAIKEYVGA